MLSIIEILIWGYMGLGLRVLVPIQEGRKDWNRFQNFLLLFMKDKLLLNFELEHACPIVSFKDISNMVSFFPLALFFQTLFHISNLQPFLAALLPLLLLTSHPTNPHQKLLALTQIPPPLPRHSLTLMISSSDSPLTHLHLLLFAAQTALTTGVCIAEYRSWPELSAAERTKIGQLYIPYFVFGE